MGSERYENVEAQNGGRQHERKRHDGIHRRTPAAPCTREPPGKREAQHEQYAGRNKGELERKRDRLEGNAVNEVQKPFHDLSPSVIRAENKPKAASRNNEKPERAWESPLRVK